MIQKTTLDNGIRVLTEQMPGVHSVTLGVWVLSGSRNEAEGQNGISHFVEHMLFRGTGRCSAKDIALQIDSVGGVLNAFTCREYGCFHAKVLADKLGLAIGLLADILHNATLDGAETEKERRVILQEILMLADDPEGSVHELFCREFWRSHPLGRPICGTVDSIDQLTRDILLEHIQQHYRGDNLLLCAAGCLNHQEVVDQVAAVFSSLPKESSKHGLSTPQPSSGMQINDRDLEQVHLCLGTPAPSQRHPQRFAAFVLNTLLGGSVSSRLFQKIREELGLAYSIYSYLNCYSDAGGLVVYSATGYQQLARVLGLILGEMRRLTREVATAQELQSAKEHLKGRLLLSLENTETRMMRLAKNEFYLGYQPEITDVVAAIEGINAEEVRQLADSLFQDELLHLQLVGRNRHIDFPRNGLTFS